MYYSNMCMAWGPGARLSWSLQSKATLAVTMRQHSKRAMGRTTMIYLRLPEPAFGSVPMNSLFGLVARTYIVGYGGQR